MKIDLPELHFIDAHSTLGQRVDPEPVLRGIRSAKMHQIEADDIAIHDIGLFLVEGVSPSLPVVGYVACKGLYAENDNSVETSNIKASIGSLYLMTRYRGQGIGRLLVDEITNRTFEKHSELYACIANCNDLSGKTFKSVGYTPVATLKSGKVKHRLHRTDWENTRHG